MNVIGKSVVKNDALEKVLGKSQFGADLKMDGMLYGKTLRSPWPHAIIKNIDVSKAEALHGVVAVLTHKDIPGSNGFGIIIKEEPVLVSDKVRQRGDALAIVAAETEEIALEALKLIEIEYEELPAVFSPQEAMEENAPKVHGETNVLCKSRIRKGDADKALESCDIVITNTYTTQMVEHCYIEPEAGMAYMDGDTVVVKVATQNVHYDLKDIALNLDIPQNKVRVIQATTGGGFGGKLDVSNQVHLALLTWKTKRPVRMVYDREESFISSSKRHPYTISYTTGASKEGLLQAVKAEVIADTGAYASYGAGVVTRACVHATGPYEVPNVSIDTYGVYTNNPKAGAMRGFGVTQMAFAHESQLDQLAEKCGLTPYEIRTKNALRPGAFTGTGQELCGSVGMTETVNKARDKASVVLQPKENKRKKRGIGVGSMWYGVGNTALPNPAGAFVNVLGDGTVVVLTGCADIGQGSNTTMAQIAAEEIGVKYQDVTVVSADTLLTPDGGATSASRQTYISGNAVRLAAKQVKEQLLEQAAGFLNTEIEKIAFKEGKIILSGEETKYSVKDVLHYCHQMGKLILGCGSFNPDTTKLDPETGYGRPYGTYAFATQVAEVEVDTQTGKVEVINIVAAHDVGTAINPQNVIGQIQGGIAQGVGYALTEEVTLKKGEITNPQLSSYIIPTTLDMPQVHAVIVEDPEATGPFGAKGVGEPALIPTAGAIANAIYNAIGIRINSLPITPEKILAALKEVENR